jgi:phosphate transport system protein
MARIEFQSRLDTLEASLQEQGEVVLSALRGAMDALARSDVERARGLVDLDELIDRVNRRVVDQVLAASSPENQEWGMRMIVVARCIERIGDNAVDIGEQTAFVVTGEFHEFSDDSTPE